MIKHTLFLKGFLLSYQEVYSSIGPSFHFPFTIIGNSGYGQPILSRTLDYNSTLRFALKTGFLSFDATRVSANNVGFPIDVAIYKSDSGEIIQKRYEEGELKEISNIWEEKLNQIIKEIPENWIDEINKEYSDEANKLFISYDQ